MTEVGCKLAMLPVHPMYAYCLFVSVEFDCAAEMLSIVAMLSVDTPVFVTTSKKQKEVAPKSKPLLHDDGDHLSLLNVYRQWMKASHKKAWCRQHSLNATALERAATIRGQLKELMQRAWAVPQVASCGGQEHWHVVRRALVRGCFT